MCHSATARPTHEVVVGRAVFVTWNPPTTARSRTRTGFVFCFFPFAVLHQPNRRGHRDIRVMCHSSSDVLARPRRPPPESSIESSAPESAKLFCEWQSRAESPTRVLRQVPSPSPPGSSRRPRQSRPKLFWSPSRFVPRQSLCMESPLESFNKPRQARPVFVRVTRQALQARPPSQSRPPSSAVHAKVVRVRARVRPRVPIVQSAKVFRPVFVHRVPAKLFLGCPVLVKPQSSAVPATVARHTTVYRLDRPRVFWSALSAVSAGSSAGPARVVRRPRQGGLPSSFWECGF